jgi:hypothetical protein
MNSSRFASAFLALFLVAVPAIGFAQGYGPNNGYSQYSGVISSIQGSALMLQNGKTVFLKNGTVIKPSGTHLQSGMRILVTGTRAGNGNINAGEIDIAGRQRHGSYGSMNGSMNGNGRYTGVISSVQGSALMLQNGTTVFLKNGTVINPSGTHLQAGMRIAVAGTPAGNGNINATEVDIAR